MIEKFRGEANRRKLLDALRRQVIVEGDEILAEKLCGVLELLEYKPGDRIIEQGAADDDLYLIIAGKVSVNVHGLSWTAWPVRSSIQRATFGAVHSPPSGAASRSAASSSVAACSFRRDGGPGLAAPRFVATAGAPCAL